MDTIVSTAEAALPVIAVSVGIAQERRVADQMLLETGMGVDLHGGDTTKAACRAVEDAMRRVSLLFLRTLSRQRRTRVSVDVTIGVPDPGAVDSAAVMAVLPVGRASIRAEHGGLAITLDDGERVLMAVAAIVVRVAFDETLARP